MSTPLEAFFLAADGGTRSGQRFCLLHTPRHAPHDAAPKALIVHVHPFAEEMNKTRRMAALQSRAFAEAGCAVLQIDLLGCGDSSGDFGDASWAAWLQDVTRAVRWLRTRYPHASTTPLWLWGVRAGCLLACEAATQMDDNVNFLFWQPAASGKALLQQFLRLKAAGEMLEGKGKGVVEGLKQQLAAGAPVDIAGYALSPSLAQGLEAASLAPVPNAQRLVWLEVSSREDAELSPAAAAPITRWQAAGVAVHSQVVSGPAFWQTTEIEEAPALVTASVAAVTSASPAAVTVREDAVAA